jgi:hypothetical protein
MSAESVFAFDEKATALINSRAYRKGISEEEVLRHALMLYHSLEEWRSGTDPSLPITFDFGGNNKVRLVVP